MENNNALQSIIAIQDENQFLNKYHMTLNMLKEQKKYLEHHSWRMQEINDQRQESEVCIFCCF